MGEAVDGADDVPWCAPSVGPAPAPLTGRTGDGGRPVVPGRPVG